MKIFKLKHILIGAFVAYFLGLTLWLIRYDNDSVKRNLGLVKNEKKYDIHFTADNNLAFHLWPRFGFSGSNMKIINFENEEKAFELIADEFFIGIKPSGIFIAQMQPDYLEIEKGQFSLFNLNGLNDLFNNIARLQLNHLKAKELDFYFLEKEAFKLTDSYLDISRFNKTKLFLNGIYKNEFFHIDMQSDSLREIFPECRNWNIHWRSKMLGNTLEFTGIFDGELFKKEENIYHLNVPEVDLEFVAIGGDLSKYNHFFNGFNFPDIGPYQVSFEMKGDAKTYYLNDFFFQFYNNKIKGTVKWLKQKLHQSISGELSSESIKLNSKLFKAWFDYLAHHLSHSESAYEISLNCNCEKLEVMNYKFKNNRSNFQISPQHNFLMRWSSEFSTAQIESNSVWYLDVSANDMLSKDPTWKFDGKIKTTDDQPFSINIGELLDLWPKKIERSILQSKNTSTEVLIDVVSRGVSWQRVEDNMSGRILWR